MDCDVCNNLLLDLVYNDLDEVRAAATRKHLESCAACRAAYLRLTRGRALAATYLPLEAPPPSDVLLAAIRAAAERASAPPAEPEVNQPVTPSAVEPHPLRIPRWLRRAGEVAMRRQVAMAAVFLLMVGVGLRFYQYQPPPRAADSDFSPAPEVIPAQEVHAPTLPAGAAPARPEASRHGLSAPGHAPPSGMPPADRRPSTVAAHAATPAPAAATAPAEEQFAQAQPMAARRIAAHGADDLADSPAGPAEPLRGGTPGSVGSLGRAAGGNAGAGSAPPMPSRWRAQARSGDAFEPPPAAPHVATVDRDLQQALPAGPTTSPLAPSPAPLPRFTATPAQGTARGDLAEPPATTWRAALTQAAEYRTRNQTASALTAYRRALDLAPDPATRRQVALEYVPYLRATGHAVEAQQVAGNLSVSPDDTAGLAAAVPPSSVPHAATSVPHFSPARPARSRPASPSASDMNTQAGF